MNTKLVTPSRRAPRQRRARETVSAILEAVRVLLRREGGSASLTTNRIAAAAGVSIGSLYQYFPNKQAIYRALLDAHLVDMQRLSERVLFENRDRPLEARFRPLIEEIVNEHARQSPLYELLLSQSAARTARDIAHEERLRGVFRAALAEAHVDQAPELERRLFVLMNTIESLAHGAALRRPPHVSLTAATDAAVSAVLAYLRA